MMTKRERLAAAIRGEKIDRPLVALWRHFPTDDADPQQLALSAVAFQTQYDWDFIKLTPASNYSVDGLGTRAAYHGNPEGVSDYTQRAVTSPQDWLRLDPLDPHSGALGQQLSAIRATRELAGPDIPIIETIFSPLAQAKNLIGGGLDLVQLRQHRNEFLEGLEIITETTAGRFVRAALAAGADGIFYAMQRASAEYLSEVEYNQVGRPLDLRILEAAQDASFNLIHLHGPHTYFDLVNDYPAQALNWHDRETGPSLAEGAALPRSGGRRAQPARHGRGNTHHRERAGTRGDRLAGWPAAVPFDWLRDANGDAVGQHSRAARGGGRLISLIYANYAVAPSRPAQARAGLREGSAARQVEMAPRGLDLGGVGVRWRRRRGKTGREIRERQPENDLWRPFGQSEDNAPKQRKYGFGVPHSIE